MKKIKVKIDGKTGKVTISTEGYVGSSCVEATRKLEEGLGMDGDDREYTEDFYKTEVNEQQMEGL